MRLLRNALVVGLVLAVAALALTFGADEQEIDNWCFEGQPWGDGRCNNEDPHVNEYNWRMGWYMYQLVNGNVSYMDIPEAFRPSPPMLTALIPGARIEVVNNGSSCRLVLILPGSQYTGSGEHVDYNGPGNTFNASVIDLGDYCGVEIYGSNNGETIIGSGGDDIIYGMGGDDTLIGLGGDDVIDGGGGDDNIDGRDGNDILIGGTGDDTMEGGAGDDTMSGGSGSDEMYGEGGDDTIIGGGGTDSGSGGDGDDTCDVEITLDTCD